MRREARCPSLQLPVLDISTTCLIQDGARQKYVYAGERFGDDLEINYYKRGESRLAFAYTAQMPLG